jgi:hypothetical protein
MENNFSINVEEIVRLATPRIHPSNEDVQKVANFLEVNQNCLYKQIPSKLRQHLWTIIQKVTSNTAFFDDDVVRRLQNAGSNFGGFSEKQRTKCKERKTSTEDTRSETFWVSYDGPDDVDRYLGHGEWDSSSGYWS